jgi:hypothetical protein
MLNSRWNAFGTSSMNEQPIVKQLGHPQFARVYFASPTRLLI